MNFFIYKMYDKEGELLYIGKTTSLEARMAAHFAKSEVELHPWKKDVYVIKVFETKSQCDMDMLEIYYINLDKPKYNLQSVTDSPTFKIRYEFRTEIILNNPLYKYNYKNDECKIGISNLEILNISEEDKLKILNKIHMFENTNLYKNIHDENNFCSKPSLLNATDKEYDILKNKLYVFFKNYSSTKSKNNKWTTYRDVRCKLRGDGYTKGYVNINESLESFDDCLSYAYIVNEYYNTPNTIENELCSITYLVSVVKYITLYKNHNLNLYIPSRRIRNIFMKWLTGEDLPKKSLFKEE